MQNLADVLSGKTHEPLKVGDRVRMKLLTDGSTHTLHKGHATKHVFGIQHPAEYVWPLGGVLVVDPEHITLHEVSKVLAYQGCWDAYVRINPDGSETLLTDIYAEPVKVGVGSFVQTGDTLIEICWDEDTDKVCKKFCKLSRIVAKRVGVTHKYDMDVTELDRLLSASLRSYSLLTRSEAYAKLGEMGGK